jgi:putative phage-type endonuclease
MTAAEVLELPDSEWLPQHPWASPGGRFVVTAPRAEDPAEVRAAWLAERQKMICASEVASVFNVSPYDDGTAWNVWALKTGRLEPGPQTYPMLRGAILEDAVVSLWVATLDYPVKTKRVGLMRSIEHPYLGASIDRLSACPRGRCIQETKTAVNSRDWEDDEVPVHTQLQVQTQLAVSGRDHAHVVYLDGYLQVHERIMERDDDLIADMLGHLGPWWQTHVVEDVEPPATAKSLDGLARLYGNADPDAVFDLPQEMWTLPDQGQDLSEQIKALEAKRDAIVARIKQVAGNASLINGAVGLAATWKPSKKIAGTDAKWRKANPELAAKYTTTVETEVLDVDALVADHPELVGDGASLYKVRTFRWAK